MSQRSLQLVAIALCWCWRPVAAAPAKLKPKATEQPVVVGLLEHHLDFRRPARPRDRFRVRVAFRRDGDRFVRYAPDPGDIRALRHAPRRYPRALRWAACHRGQRLGRVLHSRRPARYAFATVGTHRLRSQKKLPRVGDKSLAFAAWPGYPAYRPLLLTTALRCAVPDGWHPSSPPDKLIARLLAVLRAQLAQRPAPEDEMALAAYRFDPAAASVLDAAQATDGRYLVVLAIEGKTRDADRGRFTEAFFVDAAGKIRWLAAEVRLLDWGDLDGDGHSELVLASRRHNCDGYVLVHADGHTATFDWTYH